MVTGRTYTRREGQIMDILHRLGRATARQVLEELEDPPSYSAVRATLRIMVDRGYVAEDARGQSHEYRPSTPPKRARKAAVRHLVDTFFAGRTEDAVATLLDTASRELDGEELDRLQALIERARSERSS